MYPLPFTVLKRHQAGFKFPRSTRTVFRGKFPNSMNILHGMEATHCCAPWGVGLKRFLFRGYLKSRRFLGQKSTGK